MKSGSLNQSIKKKRFEMALSLNERGLNGVKFYGKLAELNPIFLTIFSASVWLVCPAKFGMAVILYPKPWQAGTVIRSHCIPLTIGTNKQTLMAIPKIQKKIILFVLFLFWILPKSNQGSITRIQQIGMWINWRTFWKNISLLVLRYVPRCFGDTQIFYSYMNTPRDYIMSFVAIKS